MINSQTTPDHLNQMVKMVIVELTSIYSRTATYGRKLF